MINLALEVAAKAHKHQKRKGTNIPYIVHPFGVALILSQAGFSEELIVAGILHDVVEDTLISLNYIKENFGERVARIVEGCTESNKFFTWKSRKEHTLQFLKTASYDIKIVACADKLDNIRAIVKTYSIYGEKIWKRFKKGREEQKWYYKGLVESLCNDDSYCKIKIFQQFKNEVENFFDKILGDI
jgi:(p)ppGpp synthase/HD superfamily hydrolase